MRPINNTINSLTELNFCVIALIIMDIQFENKANISPIVFIVPPIIVTITLIINFNKVKINPMALLIDPTITFKINLPKRGKIYETHKTIMPGYFACDHYIRRNHGPGF